MKKSISFTILLLLTFLNSFSQPFGGADYSYIDSLLYKFTDDESPGVAVGIVQDGQIVYERYLGYANLEHKVKVDKNSRFNIASNAKQYTALCILKLEEEGKLALDDDFRKYMPDILSNIKEEITIFDLIVHSSGVRDYCELLALQGKTWWKQFIDNDDALELLSNQKDLNFRAGSKHLYSNSNYILLAAIIEKVSGKDFRSYAKELFEELGMNQTDFMSNYMEIIPHKTRPYGNWGAWREEPAVTEVHGDGGLYTTLQDQLKWEQIIQHNRKASKPDQLIERSQSELENKIGHSYNFGQVFGEIDEIEYSFHNGATGAFSATFIRFPGKDLSIVLMTNNRNVPSEYLCWEIAKPMLDLSPISSVYADGPETIESLPALDVLTGHYESEDGTVIKIIEKDGSLYRELYQREPSRLIHEEGALFAYEQIKGLRMNFSKIGDSEQAFTLYMSSQPPATYVKKSDLTFDNFNKSAMEGAFYNEETDTRIVLRFEEDNNYALIKNGRERKAELILEDYLRMMSSYKIKAIRNDWGELVGLRVDNDRIRNVIFHKVPSDKDARVN